jgi:uracil-DNA glycosylase family 4
MTSEDMLAQVAQEVSVCSGCPLYHSRKRSVPGEGPANTELMFIGEGPGFHENEQGRPFVGAAGKFLDELLTLGGTQRSKVFITNVVKCRPPGNRDPEPGEILTCSHYLDRQIDAIQPKLIVTLGRHSMARFLPNAKISAVHGKVNRINNQLVVAMYHPAAALHQPALKSTIQADFSQLPAIIAQATQPKLEQTPALSLGDEKEPAEPKQLSLF